MTTPEFTKDDLDCYESFEQIRDSGEFNMCSPAARIAAGLTKAEFQFVLKNYDKLQGAYNNSVKD